MSLTWTVDHDNQMMTSVAIGDVTRADVDAMLDAMDSEGAMPYRKLFEASRGDTAIGIYDLLVLGWRMRSYHQTHGNMGPLALVIPPDRMDLLSRVLGMLAVARRPMRVFTDPDAAQRWIVRQPLTAAPRDRLSRAGD